VPRFFASLLELPAAPLFRRLLGLPPNPSDSDELHAIHQRKQDIRRGGHSD
jgi:hypothetical protein